MHQARRLLFRFRVRHQRSGVRPFLRLLSFFLLCLFTPHGLALSTDELAPWLSTITDQELRRTLDTLDDIDAPGEDGQTLLQHALCDAPQQVSPLLEAGADPGVATTQEGNALHHLYLCGFDATDARATELTRLLLDAGADPNHQDQQGRSPLHLALEQLGDGRGPMHIYRDAALLLLARGADPSLVDNNDSTALHLSIGEHSAQITTLMLDIGAGMNAVDQQGRTPLWLAAGRDNNAASFIALLERGASVDMHPPDQANTLARVRNSGNWRKIDALLKREHAFAEPLPGALLHQALFDGATDNSVLRLLEASGNDASALAGETGWLLAEQGRTELLETLIEAGLDLNHLPDSSMPPLLPASTEATALLLEYDADPALTGPDGGTAVAPPQPLPAHLDLGQQSLSEEKTRLLLAAGYPVNLQDVNGLTALAHAVRDNRLWLVRQLLAANADPRITADGSASLLPLALRQERLPLVQSIARALPDGPATHPALLTDYLASGGTDRALLEWLLIQGYSTESRDALGNTPLLLAAANDQQALLELLLYYGADTDVVNESGCGLGCYLRDYQQPRQKTLPTLADDPLAFYTLAFAPAVLLWLLFAGFALHRHRPLLPITLRLLVALSAGLIISASLFYQCDPCLLETNRQLPATALICFVLAAALLFIRLRKKPAG